MDAIFADGQFWQAIGYVIGALLALLLAAVVARYSAKFGRETWRLSVSFIRTDRVKPLHVNRENRSKRPRCRKLTPSSAFWHVNFTRIAPRKAP